MHSMAVNESNYTAKEVLTKAPSERMNESLTILHPTETHVIIVCTIVILFYVFAALGDGMFISAFVKDVRIRTTTNMLVISHLTAEFASSVLGIVTHVSTLVVHGEMFDQTAWCITASSILNSSMSAGFLSLVGISIDRYLAVVKKVHHKMTRTRVHVFLVVIWTLSVAYGIPWDLIFNGRLRWQYVAWLLVNCEASFLANEDLRKWTLADVLRGLLFFFGIFLPLVIITFASFHILRTALKSRQRIHTIGTISNHIAAAYSKSAFTTLLIIATYFLCLIPSLVLTGICEESSAKCSVALYFFAKITLCFRSACYPVIYAARNQNCLRYFRQFFHRRKIKICTNCLPRSEPQQLNGEGTSHITVSRVCECAREQAVQYHTGQDATINHKQPKLAFVDLREIPSDNGRIN